MHVASLTHTHTHACTHTHTWGGMLEIGDELGVFVYHGAVGSAAVGGQRVHEISPALNVCMHVCMYVCACVCV